MPITKKNKRDGCFQQYGSKDKMAHNLCLLGCLNKDYLDMKDW